MGIDVHIHTTPKGGEGMGIFIRNTRLQVVVIAAICAALLGLYLVLGPPHL